MLCREYKNNRSNFRKVGPLRPLTVIVMLDNARGRVREHNQVMTLIFVLSSKQEEKGPTYSQRLALGGQNMLIALIINYSHLWLGEKKLNQFTVLEHSFQTSVKNKEKKTPAFNSSWLLLLAQQLLRIPARITAGCCNVDTGSAKFTAMDLNKIAMRPKNGIFKTALYLVSITSAYKIDLECYMFVIS